MIVPLSADHDPDVPIFVLTAYAKNERADLSQQDRNDFRKLVQHAFCKFGLNDFAIYGWPK